MLHPYDILEKSRRACCVYVYPKLVAIILTTATLLCMACSVSMAVEYPCEGVANTKSVRIRKKASTSGERSGELKEGESVTVLEEIVHKNGNVWYKIKTTKGKTGYVLSDYLSVPEVDRIEAAESSPGARLMELKVHAGCSDKNQVGHNWTQYFEWNDVKVDEGEMQAYAAPDAELSLYVRIREQDEKPDTTMDTLLYTPTADDVDNGFQLTQTIKVTENAGKYKGNELQ